MNRKGQIVGQVFVYIMAIIIAGLVLLMGIRFVIHQLEVQDQILYSKFVNGVRDSVDTVDYGSVDQNTYKIPGDYSQVCFVDYMVVGSQLGSSTLEQKNSYIFDEVSLRSTTAAVKENTDMFLINRKTGSVTSVYVGNVVMQSPEFYECFNISGGSVNLQFEGVRNGVMISSWRK